MCVEGRGGSQDSLLLVESSWMEDRDPDPKPLSARFFPPKRAASPPKGKRADGSPEAAKDRFRGAKQLFLSLERKREKEKQPPGRTESPQRNLVRPLKEPADGKKPREGSEVRSATNLEVKQLEGQARWSRYEREVLSTGLVPELEPRLIRPGPEPRLSRPGPELDSRWPKSDRDTGYVSRYSREKSRSRDFDESPPAPGRQNIFTKSGKKTSSENKDKYTSKRLSRFLSRETLESDGYDKIEEFDEPDPQRNKVKRNHSRTSLKLDFRKEEKGGPEGGRRGLLRREVTELDIKGYMQQSYGDGFSRKYIPRQQGPVWNKERAMSPVRALSPGRGRFPEEDRFQPTKVIPSEYRREIIRTGTGETRYPSLDLRNDKRKTLFESEVRKQYDQGQDYRRRSYHELSDIDKIDPTSRNFQHSGRKVPAEPIGLPSRVPRNMAAYKQIPDQQRYPGLDRENSRINPLAKNPTFGHFAIFLWFFTL